MFSECAECTDIIVKEIVGKHDVLCFKINRQHLLSVIKSSTWWTLCSISLAFHVLIRIEPGEHMTDTKIDHCTFVVEHNHTSGQYANLQFYQIEWYDAHSCLMIHRVWPMFVNEKIFLQNSMDPFFVRVTSLFGAVPEIMWRPHTQWIIANSAFEKVLLTQRPSSGKVLLHYTNTQ